MGKVATAAVLTTSFILAGCASSSDDIAASYVSPYAYQNYTCPQLADEMERISVRVHEVAGGVDSTSTNDKVAMGVGLVLFWPALLMIKGNGPQQEELARLKGEYDATGEAMIQHNCNAAPANYATAPAGQAPQPVAGAVVTPTTAAVTYSSYKQWKPEIASEQGKKTKARSEITISGAAN